MEHDDLDEDIERLQIILQDGEEVDSEEEVIEVELTGGFNDEEYVSNPSRPSTSSDFTASSLPTTSVCTDADDMIRFDPNTITAETCLAMNRAYQEVLLDNLRQIEMALFENRACQKQLEDSLKEKVWSSSKKEVKFVTPYSWISISKILPYFKDPISGEIPPPNPDVKLKAEMKEDKQHVKPKQGWSKQMRKTLIDAIKLDALEQLLRPALNKVELEMTKLQQCKSKEETEACKARIEALKKDVKTKQNIPAEELLKNVDASKIDFLKIAAIHFDDRTDSSECESMWRNVLRPGINRSKWTPEEDEMLNELVKKYQMRNWQQIVDELGTNRTPYQCLQHFQYNNTVYDDSEWREDEEQMLKEVIENFAFGSSKIQWFQVAYYIENRSAEQCRKHWYQINPERRIGRWTQEEDDLLVNGIKNMGMVQDWVKIQELVPGRSAAQCRERYLKRLSEMYGSKMWTYEEDKQLMLLQNQYGNDWTEISKQFDRRTELSVQARFKRLMNWMEEIEHFNSYPKAIQKQKMHTAFEFGSQGEIKIKDGLHPNRGTMIMGRPAGAKGKMKRKAEGARLREEAGVLSSDYESEDNVEEMDEGRAEKKKRKTKLKQEQLALELFVGFYNIDGNDYRKQQEDINAGNTFVPRPVPSKNFKERRMPSVWKKRNALMDLVQTQLDLYLNKMQGMSDDADRKHMNLYDEISKKMNVEGGCEEEKKKLIFSAFGGKNPCRLTVRELLTISRKLKEENSFPKLRQKDGRKHRGTGKWVPADNSDEEMMDDSNEEEEVEDIEETEDTNTRTLTLKECDRIRLLKEKFAVHSQINHEMKDFIETKMDPSEFRSCGRKKKFCIYPKSTLMRYNGMDEDIKLNRKSMAVLMKALDVDGKKAYMKAYKGKRKLSAMAILKTADKSNLKRAKTRHQKSEIQETAKRQANWSSEYIEVADYVLDVHDELKINDDEMDSLYEEEDELLKSGKASIAVSTADGEVTKTTAVEKSFPYLPPNQTTLRGMRGLLLEHRRLIDQAETYFNPAELRDKLYDLKRKGPNPFMGVLNAIGKTESAFRRKSKYSRKKKKVSKVTASPQECFRQLHEARQSAAYQQLKARFQSMFSWPALMATIPPPKSTPLLMSLRELANQKTVQQLETMLKAEDDTENCIENGRDGANAVNVAAAATADDSEDCEELDPNLTEEEAIEQLVEKIMKEYEEHRVHKRGPPRKKNQVKYMRKERTEILKRLGLFEKMQEYKHRREALASTVPIATTSADTNTESMDITLPTISDAAIPSTSEAVTTSTQSDKDEAVIVALSNREMCQEGTNPEGPTADPPKRAKGRPKGSKTKKIELTESEIRKSQRTVEHKFVKDSTCLKKRTIENKRYTNMRELIPQKMRKLVAQISDIPFLNDPLPEQTTVNPEPSEGFATSNKKSKQADDSTSKKKSTRKRSYSKKEMLKTFDDEGFEEQEKRTQDTIKKINETKALNGEKITKMKESRALNRENKRLAAEVRNKIKQEILMEFEQNHEEEGGPLIERETPFETRSEMLTSTTRQQLEGAEALVALALNTGNTNLGHDPMVLNSGLEAERTKSVGRENVRSDEGKAQPVVVHNSFHLEKVTTVKIPRSEQSNSTGTGNNNAKDDVKQEDMTGSVSENNQSQEPIFIGLPVVVGGATQMACIPILPDKDGTITFPGGSKVDVNINKEQSLVSVSLKPNPPTSEQNQT